MSRPVWLVPGVILLGILTWVSVHRTLKSKKLNISLSRIVMIEMVPSFVFAVTTFYVLLPALHYLLLAERIAWASPGITWRLATFVGAAALSLSPIGWISLLEDEAPEGTSEDITQSKQVGEPVRRDD